MVWSPRALSVCICVCLSAAGARSWGEQDPGQVLRRQHLGPAAGRTSTVCPCVCASVCRDRSAPSGSERAQTDTEQDHTGHAVSLSLPAQTHMVTDKAASKQVIPKSVMPWRTQRARRKKLMAVFPATFYLMRCHQSCKALHNKGSPVPRGSSSLSCESGSSAKTQAERAVQKPPSLVRERCRRRSRVCGSPRPPWCSHWKPSGHRPPCRTPGHLLRCGAVRGGWSACTPCQTWGEERHPTWGREQVGWL